MALCCQPISRARSVDHLAAVESGLSQRGLVNTDITPLLVIKISYLHKIRRLRTRQDRRRSPTIEVMVALILAIVTYCRAFFLPRHRLGLEAAALRQQLAVLKRKQPRPRLRHLDRLFWMALRRWWPDWANALFLVQADTVVSWHRLGFRLFWRRRSRQRGRPKVSEEIRHLIRRLKSENPSWGAPRIHGELLQLGFQI